MKYLTLKKLLSTVALTALFSASSAQSADGVIHFRGEIVESGCGVIQQEQAVSISCNRQGKPAVYKATLAQLANYSVQSDSPIKTHLRYIDSSHHLAVLEITYL